MFPNKELNAIECAIANSSDLEGARISEKRRLEDKLCLTLQQHIKRSDTFSFQMQIHLLTYKMLKNSWSIMLPQIVMPLMQNCSSKGILMNFHKEVRNVEYYHN